MVTNNTIVKMTPLSYIVYNWIHNLHSKDYKIGPYGFKLANINQPYNKNGERTYNLPVPGIDVSEYELWIRIFHYRDATVYCQTGYDPIKITKYKTRFAYSYTDEVTVQAVKDNPKLPLKKSVSAIYLENSETGNLMTYWTRIGGVEPFLAQSTVMITSTKQPWQIEDQDGGLMSKLTQMASHVDNYISGILDTSRIEPSKPGIYIAKNGLALCHLPNNNWILDTAKFNSAELTWTQVKSCMPKEQFPLEYRGTTLWN